MESIYTEDDQTLIQRIREDENEEAFNILYSKHWEEVYHNALYLLKDHVQAQDITQEVFVHLWLRCKELQINNLKAYLFVSVRNRALRVFEKKKHFIPFEILIHKTENILTEETADFLILQHEFLQAYRNLLSTLPSQRRKIFDSYFEEGLSTDEIARQLSLSRKTVQNQLGRAVAFLKTNLSHLSSFLFTFFL